MTELQTIKRAKMYLDKMALGINPLDETAISQEDLLNNDRISRCLIYVSGLLTEIINAKSAPKAKSRLKQPFLISEEQLNEFAFSEEPITLTEITSRLNSLVSAESFYRLNHKYIMRWLLDAGYLEEIIIPYDKIKKEPTSRGFKIGIKQIKREGKHGSYDVLLYSLNAQRIIVENIPQIVKRLAAERVQLSENVNEPWSENEVAVLKSLADNKSTISEIAAEIKRTDNAVRAKLKRLGYDLTKFK